MTVDYVIGLSSTTSLFDLISSLFLVMPINYVINRDLRAKISTYVDTLKVHKINPVPLASDRNIYKYPYNI